MGSQGVKEHSRLELLKLESGSSHSASSTPLQDDELMLLHSQGQVSIGKSTVAMDATQHETGENKAGQAQPGFRVEEVCTARLDTMRYEHSTCYTGYHGL